MSTRTLQTICWHSLWVFMLFMFAWAATLNEQTEAILKILWFVLLIFYANATFWIWAVPQEDSRPTVRSIADMPEADRVAEATRLWDQLGVDNAGRRYRKRLFAEYFKELDTGVAEQQIANSIRRKEEKNARS